LKEIRMRHAARSFALLAALSFGPVLLAADENAPPESWVYRGDGLVVTLHEQGGAHAGTVTLDGKTFPFAGSIKDGLFTGTFTADGQKFPFTLKTTDAGAKKAVFESEGTKYNVTESDDASPAPAPQGGDVPEPPAPEPRTGGMPKPAAPKPQPTPAAGAPRTFVLEKRAVRDQKTQLDISTLLIPRGWNLANETLWRVNLIAWVAAYVEAVDPQTGAAVRWLPVDQFAADATMFNQARQQGVAPVSMQGFELTPQPLNVEQYVTQVALPRYRKVPGAKVVASEKLPWLEREVAAAKADMVGIYKQAGYELSIPAGRVRIEYAGPDGQPMEEDVYCALMHWWNPQAIAMAQQIGLPGSSNFYPERLYSLAAPKGQLDAMRPILQTVVDSARTTPKWDTFVLAIERMRRQAAIDDHKIRMAVMEEVTAEQRRTWEARMESQDRIAQARGDNLAGVHRFVEPTDPAARVIVPQTYGRVFSDGQGHYVLTNDPLYSARQDPNLSGNWDEMQPQR
jgi:hypothetical protein